MVLVVASTVCLGSGRAWDEWWCEMLGDVCGVWWGVGVDLTRFNKKI